MWNMKKWILALLILGLAFPAYAGQRSKTVIAETTLTKSESEVSVTLNTQGVTNLTIFVEYDENGAEPLTFTLDSSYDGSNWVNAKYYDYDGGATLQTSESISADGWYYAVWKEDFTTPYVRVHLIGDTWGATSTATVTVYAVREQ